MFEDKERESQSASQSWNEVKELEQDLRNKMKKIKQISESIKFSCHDENIYNTSATGVSFFDIQQLIFPSFHSQTNYSDQFWKTYLKNEVSFMQIKDISQKMGQVQKLSKDIENLYQEFNGLYKQKGKKKNRRLATQIQKKFECPYSKCYKYYGSDVSLNLHIKLKHNGGNKTDREKLAEQICQAQLNGESIPQIKINLPPGFIEEYKKENLFAERLAEKIGRSSKNQ